MLFHHQELVYLVVMCFYDSMFLIRKNLLKMLSLINGYVRENYSSKHKIRTYLWLSKVIQMYLLNDLKNIYNQQNIKITKTTINSQISTPIVHIQKIQSESNASSVTFNLPLIYFNSSPYSTFFVDFKWIDYTGIKRIISGLKTLNQKRILYILTDTLLPRIQVVDGGITYLRSIVKPIEQTDTMQIEINMKRLTYTFKINKDKIYTHKIESKSNQISAVQPYFEIYSKSAIVITDHGYKY